MGDGKGKNLIFLISQPGAGSTLAQRVLMNHPSIHSVAEPWIMLPLCYAIRDKGHSAEYDGSQWAAVALQEFLDECPGKRADYFEAVRLMSTFLYERAMTGTGAHFFLDKTPRYYNIIPDLGEIFPEARFIILFRNPMAVFASIYRRWGREQLLRVSAYRYDLLNAPKLLLEGLEYLEERALVIHYEDLVWDAVDNFGRVFSWLGLDFTESVVNYSQTPQPAGRSGDVEGVERYSHPNDSRVNRWTDLAKNSQLRRLALEYAETLGAETISSMGYDYGEITRCMRENGKVDADATLGLAQVLTDSTKWSRGDWLRYWKSREIQARGAGLGKISFVSKYYRTLARDRLDFLLR